MLRESHLSTHTKFTESTCLPFGEHSLATRSENLKTSEIFSCSLEAADTLTSDRSTNEPFESNFFMFDHQTAITLILINALSTFVILIQDSVEANF